MLRVDEEENENATFAANQCFRPVLHSNFAWLTSPFPYFFHFFDRQPKINFVNAVLRGISEDGKTTLETTTSTLDNIHPWLANEWIQAYGEKKTRTIVEAAMTQSPIFVSINHLYKGNASDGDAGVVDDAKATVSNNPVEMVRKAFLRESKPSNNGADNAIDDTMDEPEVLPIGCIRVPSSLGGTVSKWPLYHEGAWWVQDPSATLPAIALSHALQQTQQPQHLEQAQASNHVVDLCSAPGGKTAQLCSLKTFGKIVAVELSKARTKLLQQNLKRLGMQDQCTVQVEDGRYWLPESGRNSMDGVLLDAPCSATGLGSRQPDILTKSLEKGSLDELVVTQRELLIHAVKDLLKPNGGVLVYAACSLLPQEGEAQMEWLLQGGGGQLGDNGIEVETLPIQPGELPGFDSCITEQGWLRILPGVLKDSSLQFCDGFFVARLTVKHVEE